MTDLYIHLQYRNIIPKDTLDIETKLGCVLFAVKYNLTTPLKSFERLRATITHYHLIPSHYLKMKRRLVIVEQTTTRN